MTLTTTNTENDTVTKTEQGGNLALAEDTRTITGRVLPWDEAGTTNVGSLVFPPGSISVPHDISRVKLLAGHSPHGIPVGVATSWESKPDGLYMTFKLGSHPAADEALALASEHVIDSFSIEAMGIQKRGDRVESSLLKAVALVPFPAFANARVAAALAEDYTPAVVSSDNPDDSPETDEPQDDKEETPETTAKKDEPMNPTAVTPTLANERTPDVHASLNDVLDYIVATREGRPDEAHAQLVDITYSGMTNAIAPAWLGELWGGVEYERQIIPLLANKPLRGMKAHGYRWTKKPGVAKYSGDKAAIPSKPAAVETVEVTAQRWAGGNDLDRAFYDFNNREVLEAYWRAMAEDYALQTDIDAAAFLNENATVIEAPAADFLRGIARAGLAVRKATHINATFALVNPDDVESVLSFAELDTPKFLNLVPVANPENWTLSEQITKGTAIVGTKTAVDFFELQGSPLRVEAEHLAHGGRDGALFGYTAHSLAKAGGLQKITINGGGA